MSEINATLCRKAVHFNHSKFGERPGDSFSSTNLGRVRCYNTKSWRDFILLILSKFFNFAITVEADGKSWLLNRREFNEHLKSNGLEEVSEKTKSVAYELLIMAKLSPCEAREGELEVESIGIDESLRHEEDHEEKGEEGVSAAKGSLSKEPFYKSLPSPDVERMTEEMVRGMRDGDEMSMLNHLLHGADITKNFYALIDEEGRVCEYTLKRPDFEKSRKGFVKYSLLAWAVEKEYQLLATAIYALKGERLSLDDKYVTMEYVEDNDHSHGFYRSKDEGDNTFVVIKEGLFTFGKMSDRLTQKSDGEKENDSSDHDVTPHPSKTRAIIDNYSMSECVRGG